MVASGGRVTQNVVPDYQEEDYRVCARVLKGH